MPRPSRFIRPENPRPIALQNRDRAVLLAIYQHRYLTSDHVAALLFPDVGCQVARVRLHKLWDNRYLDRHVIPVVLDGRHPPPAIASRPLYMLARRGAEIVAGDLGLDLAVVPHSPRVNAQGYATLLHHLVVTDLLVAMEVGLRGRGDVELVAVDRETALRQRLAAFRQSGKMAGSGVVLGGAIVPDGAFTLRRPDSGEAMTFAIEVVRADVKGGNKTLAAKLRLYATLNRQAFFRRMYGYERLRAVLIATTSARRVERLRAIAAALPNGRGLFWFGVYRARDARGRETSAFTPVTILAPLWTTYDGVPQSLVPSTVGEVGPGLASGHIPGADPPMGQPGIEQNTNP